MNWKHRRFWVKMVNCPNSYNSFLKIVKGFVLVSFKAFLDFCWSHYGQASFTYRGFMRFISSNNKFASSTNYSFMRFTSSDNKFTSSTNCSFMRFFMRFTSSDKFTSSAPTAASCVLLPMTAISSCVAPTAAAYQKSWKSEISASPFFLWFH